MNLALRSLAAPLLLLCLTGMTKKPEIAVRFFVEANEQDTGRFAEPIELKYPPRRAFVEKVPAISERDIKAVYPFRAPDGSWGCAFKLDHEGRLALEIASTKQRGRSMVAFVGTQKGTHQVIDMMIDQRIDDGIITIQKGLTDLEIAALQKKFPTVGASKKKKGKMEKVEPEKREPAPTGPPRLEAPTGT